MSVSSQTAANRTGLVVAGLWVLSIAGARVGLDVISADHRILRITTALIPCVTTAFLLWFAIQSVRSMDELHRRVHLEALAIAYPLATLLIVTLGLLQLAVGLSMDNWSYRHVAAFLPMLYFAGLAIAWRRYK